MLVAEVWVLVLGAVAVRVVIAAQRGVEADRRARTRAPKVGGVGASRAPAPRLRARPRAVVRVQVLGASALGRGQPGLNVGADDVVSVQPPNIVPLADCALEDINVFRLRARLVGSENLVREILTCVFENSF